MLLSRQVVSTSMVQAHSFMDSQSRIGAMATALGGTNAPPSAAVVKNGRRPHMATASRATDNRQFQLSRKQALTLGAWNFRTTNDSDASLRPERATALICRELEKANIDICALSEVRHPGTCNVVERSHTIFWSGGSERTAGAGFAISNRLSAQGFYPTPVNDRLMLVRIPLANGNYLTLVSVYAPTMQRTPEEKEFFYGKLCSCLVPVQNDLLIILGDFNARVGRDYKFWPDVIGKHGVGKMNSNGLMLLEFCTRLQLSIMGTMFQLRDSLKNT